jgi:hypothetical protein
MGQGLIDRLKRNRLLNCLNMHSMDMKMYMLIFLFIHVWWVGERNKLARLGRGKQHKIHNNILAA